MDVVDVMDELGDALDTIAGLNVTPHDSNRITPPTALIMYPEITYDLTFGRGSDTQDFEVFVCIAKSDQPTIRANIAPYLRGSGSKSVKQVLEAHTYTACDVVVVKNANVEVVTIGTIDYVAAVFTVSVTGSGA